MSQSTFSIRMDEDLKKQFDFLCSQFGMTASTAINIYARTVVREQKIPFEIKYEGKSIRERGLDAFNTLRASSADNSAREITLDEINAEISAARREKKQ